MAFKHQMNDVFSRCLKILGLGNNRRNRLTEIYKIPLYRTSYGQNESIINQIKIQENYI